MPDNTSRWGTLAITSLFVFAICISYQSIPPVLSLIIEDTGISHAQAGLLMSVYTLPGIFVAIPLSLFASKFGRIKAVGITALCLLIAGSVILLLAKDFILLLLGRLIIGIAAGSLPVAGQPVIARAFMNSRLGLAMGFYGALMPIGTVIPLVSFGAAGLAWGWRSVIVISIITAVIALIVYAFFFKAPPEFPTAGRKKESINIHSALKMGWPVWIMAVCCGFFAFGNFSLTTFLPDLIYRSGINLNVAGSITSIIMICGLVISPLSGYFLDAVKFKILFMIVAGMANALLVFLLPGHMDMIILYMVLIGIFIAPVPATISAIAPGLAGPAKISLVFSVIFTINNIGLSLGPYIIGFLRDFTGSYQTSFWVISLFFLLVAILGTVLLFRQIKKTKAAAV
jgi:predicted MFS family arabinose efflux permease